MRKPLKWALISAASIVGIVALAVTYIAATFDPNDYRSDIVRLVQEKTGRKLDLKGKIGLTFYPTLGMKLGETILSERRSEREFVRVSEATVAVKLMPLLSKQVIVDAIEVRGLRATITRDKAGHYNFEDLTAADRKDSKRPSSASLEVDIDHIKISDSELIYADHSTGAQYRLTSLNLKTGRIATGVTTPVDLAVTITSTKDKAQLETNLKTRLTFDVEHQLYKFDDFDFSTTGSFGTLSTLNATAKGALEARLGTGELVAKKLTAAGSAKEPDGELKAKLDVPALTLTSDKVAGEKLTLEATRSSGKNRLVAKITVGGVQGTFKTLQAGPLDAHIETQGERTMKAHVTGSFSGNMETKSFQSPNLKLVANIMDAKLAKGAIDADLSAAARADLTRQTASLEFSGKLDESQVNGTAAVRKFSPLAMTFDVNADQLNLDRLMAKNSSSASEKIDLSALEGLNLVGAMKVGKLTFMNLKSSQVRADIKVASGRLDVAPLSAKLYDGALNGSISAQAAQMPAFSIKQALSGVNLGALLRDAAQIDTLQGKGTVNVDVTTRGASVDALKKALNGNAAINIADGAIRGFDIAGTLRGARSKLQQLRGEQVQQSNKAAATDFSEMKASFNVMNGVAHNDDLTMKSPLLRVTGAGDIDIGRDSMNYLLKATVVATTKGQGGKELAELSGLTVPVKLSGALESPQYAVDFGGMATEFAKHQLKDEVLKRAGLQSPSGATTPKVTKVEDVVKGFKSIFKK